MANIPYLVAKTDHSVRKVAKTKGSDVSQIEKEQISQNRTEQEDC